MHFLRTLIKAVCLTIALGAPTLAFANVATAPASPSVEAPVAPPVVICANGPSWDEAKDGFVAKLEAAGANYLGLSKVFPDGSFAALWDVRGYTAEPIDPATPIFVIGFDVNGCYVASFFIDEVTAKDGYGIVIASAN